MPLAEKETTQRDPSNKCLDLGLNLNILTEWFVFYCMFVACSNATYTLTEEIGEPCGRLWSSLGAVCGSPVQHIYRSLERLWNKFKFKFTDYIFAGIGLSKFPNTTIT